MKKILITKLSLLVLISFLSLSGCDVPVIKECGECGGGDGGPEDITNDMESGGTVSKGNDNISSHSFTIYAGKGGKLYRSLNDSNNVVFKKANSGTIQDLNAVAIRNLNTWAFAVGNNGVIIRSTNEGNNWALMPSVTSANLFATCFGFSGFQFAVGNNGTILRSSNLGSNWSVISSGTTRNLKAVSEHAAGEKVIAAGEKGTILRSTTSGFNWVNLSLPDTTIDFLCINNATNYGIEIENFFIAGSQGKIYKSTNRGATWLSKNSGTTNTLRSIFFINDDSGVVAGDNGTIKLTTDAGETWFSYPFFNSNTDRNYKSVSLINPEFKTFSALSDTLWFVSDDSIKLVPANLNLNLTAIIEGFYDQSANSLIADTVTVYLRNAVTPFAKIDSAKNQLSSSGTGTFRFSNATNGTNYYLEVKHRNSIRTWSKTTVGFASGTLNYNFTTAANKAYGDNMKQVDTSPVYFAFFSGDANQDGFVNLTDVISVNNGSSNFSSGYVLTDMNGDLLTDLTDVVITNNNSSQFVSIIQP